jgi:hypothetical protein
MLQKKIREETCNGFTFAAFMKKMTKKMTNEMHDDSLNGSECVKLAYQMTLEEKPITSRGLHQVGYVPSAVT